MPKPKIGIIGAGIAGLTAADVLSAAGYKVTLHEARDRAGGRIHTLHSSISPNPIELGAEFIHGSQNETWEILGKSPRFHPIKFPDRHWEFRDNRLIENKHFWDDLSKVTGKFEDMERDTSFKTFLRKQGDKPRRLRSLARDYVEGFHAAAPDQASIRALEESEESAEKTNGQKSFRFTNGYSSLVDWLVEKLRRRKTIFHFNQAVSRVSWERQSVELFKADQFLARHNALLVTLPVGVLQTKVRQQGAVKFDPEIRARKNLWKKLRMGNVIKLTFVFQELFWPKKVFGFIHAHGKTFPTWWMDKGSATLVAWSGGPKADDLGSKSKEKMVDQALAELSLIFKISKTRIEQGLLESFVHDWRTDPFAHGAYSYFPVGTTGIPQQLSEPIEDTLFFAGEVLAPPGEQGTVHGAIASGKIAARQILDCLGGTRK